LGALAVCLAAATGGVDGFVDCRNDFGDADLVGLAAELVTAARSSHPLDHAGTSQAGEQLLQIGE